MFNSKCNVIPQLGNRRLCYYSKGKAAPLQARSGPERSRKFLFPFFMITAQNCRKVVALRHRPPLPWKIYLVLISDRVWINPKIIVRPEEICHWKISMTPLGIECLTCRFPPLLLHWVRTVA